MLGNSFSEEEIDLCLKMLDEQRKRWSLCEMISLLNDLLSLTGLICKPEAKVGRIGDLHLTDRKKGTRPQKDLAAKDFRRKASFHHHGTDLDTSRCLQENPDLLQGSALLILQKFVAMHV